MAALSVCQLELLTCVSLWMNETDYYYYSIASSSDSSNSSSSSSKQPNNLNYFWTVSVFSFRFISFSLSLFGSTLWWSVGLLLTNTLQVLNNNNKRSSNCNCNWRSIHLSIIPFHLWAQVSGAPNSLNLPLSEVCLSFFPLPLLCCSLLFWLLVNRLTFASVYISRSFIVAH